MDDRQAGSHRQAEIGRLTTCVLNKIVKKNLAKKQKKLANCKLTKANCPLTKADVYKKRQL